MASTESDAAQAPVVETERLRLRAHRRDDFEACAAMWADPLVTRFIGGKPSTRQQTWMRVLAYAGHWPLMRFGYWAIEEKATGAFIGELGFADFQRDVPPALRNIPELGWALAPAAHGRGYAGEAIGAALAWGDAHLGAPRTICFINDDNVRSIRLAERNGYTRFDRIPLNETPVLAFERRLVSS